MKLLYISTNEPDYLADCLFHGFYQLLGKDFTHNGRYDLMYKTLTTAESLSNSYGRGFTVWGNLPEYLNENDDIENKIKSKYFDLIVYGSFRRRNDYYDLVKEVYEKDKVVFVDGEDDQWVWDSMGHRLFKRELTWNAPNAHPIFFAIPAEKITKNIPSKIKKIADYIPQITGSGYMYNTEEEYYNGYKESLYGLTHKKSGWDCMRHYEILGNYCMPYFIGLEDCPEGTLANLPKELLFEGKKLAENFEEQKYFRILDEVFRYTQDNLTTKHIANYIISKL